MKTLTLILFCSCFLATSVFAEETVNIKSSAPFILALGQYVYPVDSVYTVTLTDTSVLVQGKVYEPPEKPFVPLPKPDREKNFLDWVIRTPADSAMALLEAGGTPEQAKALMDNFFRQFPESDTFSVKFEGRIYRITCRGKEMITWVPHGKREPKPDYRKNTLTPSFEYLCRHLRAGDLMLKGDGYLQPIPAKELSPSLIRQLKGITQQTAVKRSVGFQGRTRYEGMRIKGQTREMLLGSGTVTDLVQANGKEAGHED